MSDKRENYCKLLGLNPYKINEYTDQMIKDQIVKVENEWRKDLSNTSVTKKAKYIINENLKLLTDIRSTMDSPILKKEEFEEAQKILERKCSKLRREAIILENGDVVIPAASADKLVERFQWKGIDGKTAIRASGLKNVIPPKPAPTSITSAYRMISDIGAHTPYDLINSIIEIPDMDLSISKVSPGCDHDELRKVYDNVSKRLNNLRNGRIPNLQVYVDAVRAVKSNISTDENLETLVEYGNCMRLLAPAFEQMDEDSGSQFSRAYIDNILTDYVSKNDADPELCILILEDYCVRRLYAANFSKGDSKLDSCPRCRALIYTGENCFFCPSCGSAINEICPVCGRAQTASNTHCVGCGIELEEALKKAMVSESEIRGLLKSGQTDMASKMIGELETNYPSFEPIPKLRAKVRDNSSTLMNLCEQIGGDYMAGNHFSVKKAVEDVKIDFPQVLDREDVSLRYNESCRFVSEADRLCVEAALKEGDEAMELYIRASEICPDHPDTIAKLSSYPPEGPADAEIQFDGNEIEIKYAVPEDRRGMTFCIYRNEGSVPEVDVSTRPIAEIDGWTYSDKTAEPGVEYYYKIFSKRWGIMSEEYAQCGPGIVIREVTNVHIEPCDDGLRITYLQPAGADRVRIWRKQVGNAAGEGDEDEILHNDTGVIIDDGLMGGTSYVYLFVAEYNVNGRTERSCGTHFTGMTSILPNPIEDLSVVWDRKEGCYVAKWSGPQDAVLYYSNIRDTVPGEQVSVKDLSTRMTRIEPLDSTDGRFRFNLPDATVTYICPTISVGNTTIKGGECLIANLRPFRNVTKTMTPDTCRLNMDWPQDAEYALAVVNGVDSDGRPSESRVSLSREDYENAGGFDIALNGSSRTRITLHAVYMVEDGTMESIGLTADVFSGEYSKVRYTLEKESVKGDRKKLRVVVRFDCPGETVIPRCVMVASEGGIPLRQKDGTVVWESDDPLVLTEGTTECDFVLPKEDVSLQNMRLFFPDRNDYNKYRLIHPIYRRK